MAKQLFTAKGTQQEVYTLGDLEQARLLKVRDEADKESAVALDEVGWMASLSTESLVDEQGDLVELVFEHA